MRIKQKHVEQLGFEYKGEWDDCWKLRQIQLYNHPFKVGWTVEQPSPIRQIYSVKALHRLLRKFDPNKQTV